MQLIETSYNPIPGEPRIGLVEVEVGVFLRYALWRSPKATGKGTVILLQGRSEYLEKNFEIVGELIARGYDVLGFDWRGQGGSSRLLENKQAGYVDSFSEYVADLNSIISQVALPDCRSPFHILGHSTGSLVALMAAPEIGNKISRMVLCSPLFGMGGQRFSVKTIGYMAGTLAAVGLGGVYMTGGAHKKVRETFEDNVFTTDKRRFNRMMKLSSEHPEIAIGGATASWVFAASKAIQQISEPEFLRSVNIPILVINAGLDTVVDNRANERVANSLRLGSSLTIKGARHELWQEQDLYREQFLAAFTTFVPGTQAETAA